MERVLKCTRNGKTIVVLDLSNSQPEETMDALPAAHELISTFNQKSALVLTDVRNATYNKQVAEGIKGFVRDNTPYIRASAVVGAEGISQILLNTVVFLTRREIKAFDDREKAMDWLVMA